QRRQKFVYQIAVGGMDLQKLKTGSERASRRFTELAHDIVNHLGREFLWNIVVRVKRHSARSHGHPAARFQRNGFTAGPGRRRACLPASMRQLHSWQSILRADKLKNGMPRLDMRVFVDAGVER